MSDTMPARPVVREVSDHDADALAAIYNHYVRETIVTFEEEPITAAVMQTRVNAVRMAQLPWLVLEVAGTVAGYAYASKWRERVGYRFSVESTVYLRHDVGGRGYGTVLYDALLPALAARNVHAVMGGIALPNAASVALHEKIGMQKVAHFSEVGFKFGRWLDVGYWQMQLPTFTGARHPDAIS
jgi:L-amino acid N-acyltransferase YncA